MSRAARLLDLVQALRRRRKPVAAATLAVELGVSLRTLYRDVATLQGQGAPIRGEAGLGYVLEAGFFLPPLMFSDDEIDAVILGLRLVAGRGDEDLGAAADDALVKIGAMLPPAKVDAVATSGMLAPKGAVLKGEAPKSTAPTGAAKATNEATILTVIRQAIRAERKLGLRYEDKKAAATTRVVWPVAVGFFTGSEVLAAWCELRADFRHFRLDRIRSAQPLAEPLPRRHRILLAEWRSLELDDYG